MERATEWFTLLTCIIVGLSHILQAKAWAEVFARLHRLGKPGAFANGALSLIPGTAFVVAHPVWSGPGIVLTLLGWALLLKGAVCFLAPSLALRSMSKAGASDGRPFIIGGVVALIISGILGYALWIGRAR
jgi:hypothetical protein